MQPPPESVLAWNLSAIIAVNPKSATQHACIPDLVGFKTRRQAAGSGVQCREPSLLRAGAQVCQHWNRGKKPCVDNIMTRPIRAIVRALRKKEKTKGTALRLRYKVLQLELPTCRVFAALLATSLGGPPELQARPMLEWSLGAVALDLGALKHDNSPILIERWRKNSENNRDLY